MEKVSITDGCWEWTAHCIPKGYGHFRIGNKMHRAHRLSYELHVGLVPDGMMVLHQCDNRRCVRPDHLYLGTQEDNTRDMIERNRQATGDRVGTRRRMLQTKVLPPVTPRKRNSGGRRLTEADVIEARRSFAEGAKLRDLAERYGVAISTLSHAITRRTWRHLA